MIAIYWIFRNSSPSRMDVYFRKLQLVSAAIFSFAHGTNDAQKTMGIITGVLFTTDMITALNVPIWVIFAAHAAIGLGTLSGGWRIVQTMGGRLTRLKATRRICGRNRGGHLHSVLERTGDAGLDDSRDCGSHRRRRLHSTNEGRSVGIGYDDCVGLGADDPSIGAGGRGLSAGCSGSSRHVYDGKGARCERPRRSNAYFTGVNSLLAIIRSIMPYSSACSGIMM